MIKKNLQIYSGISLRRFAIKLQCQGIWQLCEFRSGQSWKAFLKEKQGQTIIIVTNTPYEEISVPCNAKDVLVTFSIAPELNKAAGKLKREMLQNRVNFGHCRKNKSMLL